MVNLEVKETVDILSIKKWGRVKFEIVTNANAEKQIKILTPYKSFVAEEINCFANGNIILKGDENGKSRLLCGNNFSKPYNEISIEVYDDKYRIAHNDDGVIILSETTGDEVGRTKWKSITGIYNDIAIVNSKDRCYNLYRIDLGTKYSNELQGASEIKYVADRLFKYRVPNSRGLYFLYNAANRKSSEDITGYIDLQRISDQLAMGITANGRWDFIRTMPPFEEKYLPVVCSSYEAPEFEDDAISIVYDYDENDNEKKSKINFSGTILSDENELGIKDEEREYTSVPIANESNIVGIEELVFPIVTIGRIVWVDDGAVHLSGHTNTIFSKKSLNKYCNIENGTVCWVLEKDNLIVITKRGRNISLPSHRTILYKKILPKDFTKLNICREDGKYYIIDCFICTEEDDILDSAIKFIESHLKEKANEVKTEELSKESANEKLKSEALKIKNIYNFLKENEFKKGAIYKSLCILFPSIDIFIDLTNVKVTNELLCKRIEEHTKTYNAISYDNSKFVEMLKLNDKELDSLNYYTKFKKLSMSEAIEYISIESPEGERILQKYYELSQLGTILSNERKILREAIIDEIINLPLKK